MLNIVRNFLCKISMDTNKKYKYISNQINKKIKIIPILYNKYEWLQNLFCRIYRRKKYNPYCYKYKFYAICKNCFNENKIKYNIIFNK